MRRLEPQHGEVTVQARNDVPPQEYRHRLPLVALLEFEMTARLTTIRRGRPDRAPGTGITCVTRFHTRHTRSVNRARALANPSARAALRSLTSALRVGGPAQSRILGAGCFHLNALRPIGLAVVTRATFGG